MSAYSAHARAYAGPRATTGNVPVWLRPPFVAVLGAMTFNFALCFVNTNVVGIGTGAAIGCEVVIILTVLLYAYPVLIYSQFLVIGAALLYLVALSALRYLLGDPLDVKPVRDILIPIAFFLLGSHVKDVKTADRIVQVAVWIVVTVGLFEYFFPDVYTRFFNIASFYIERGAMQAAQGDHASNLFTSGMRPEGGVDGGRNLLPFLGNHRVSSVFLEPVSAGNFGIIACIWGLVRSFATRRVYWGLFAAAAVITVMADSRFGAYFCIASFFLALCPAFVRTTAVAVMPIIGILAVTVVPGLLPLSYGVTNGFIGRIILAGSFFDYMDLANWFGVRAPGFVAADSGYAYAINSLGIVGVAMFWTLLMTLRAPGRWFGLYRDLAAAYFAFLLLISDSPFTIKTGSLLWFLAGVLSVCRADWAPAREQVASYAIRR